MGSSSWTQLVPVDVSGSDIDRDDVDSEPNFEQVHVHVYMYGSNKYIYGVMAPAYAY
jgi:hypothetical protein